VKIEVTKSGSQLTESRLVDFEKSTGRPIPAIIARVVDVTTHKAL
jgi:hypothetical protein